MVRRTAFHLTRRVKFPSYWPEQGISKWPAKPLNPKPYTFQDLSCPSSRFTSTNPLYIGPSKWSQVYLGSLTSSSPPGLGTGSERVKTQKHDDVVLKVFDRTMFPDAEQFDTFDRNPGGGVSKGSYRLTDELMSWAEVYAYATLSPLQGVTIPRFIDAFMVKSPKSDRECMAIAMSHVNGKSIIKRARELGSQVDGDSRWFPLARDLFCKVYQIHKLGICGLDIREANNRVVHKAGAHTSSTSASNSNSETAWSPESESVMIFDFGDARPSTFPTPEEMTKHCVDDIKAEDIRDLYVMVDTMCEIEYQKPYQRYARTWGFLQWARREHLDDAWMREWWEPFLAELEPKLEG